MFLYEVFSKSLLTSKPLPCYQISGEDVFWSRLAYERLLEFADPIDRVVIEAPQNIEEGLFDINVFPMLSDYKVVVFDGYQKFVNEDKKKIAKYLNNPVENAILILYNCELIKEKNAEKYVFSSLNQNELIPVIIDFAKKSGGVIEDSAARVLANFAENDMGIISNELAKLVSYADNKPITIEMVKECVVPTITYQIYHFADAVANGDYEKSYKVLYSLTKSQFEYSRYLSSLTNYYRTVFYAKISSLRDRELADTLSAREFVITKARRIAKRYLATELLELLKLLYRLEYEFKSGKISMDNALELAIAEAVERRVM